MSVRKIGALIPVSDELAADYAGIPERMARQLDIAMGATPTPREKAELERRKAEAEARKAAYEAAMVPFREALAAVEDPLSRQILDLHREEEGNCTECGWGDDPAPFPCDTVDTVAGSQGIEVPTW